ncbi:MAG: C1 family peptidase [Nitrospirota bacterium]
MAAKRSVLSGKRTLDAFPDRIDLRDWSYTPTLAALPDAIVNCHKVPAILDQGQEGACTGFALAAVINYLLHQRGVRRAVSPRMLYEMARCYDEWPGEKYEGSSARGAMKGWARHGVCESSVWPNQTRGRGTLDAGISRAALDTPCGAYYRIKHREVRDVHAAIHETGAVYCTMMVHDGWDSPGRVTVKAGTGRGARTLPVIKRIGQANSGHAIALVGYTRDGFIVQNSWGSGWGAGGFAVVPYEDFILHTTDVWVAQVGVPLSVDLWGREGAADTTAGRFRGRNTIPLSEVRPYVVDVGNNGELSQSGDYWTSESDLQRLFIETIPQTAAARRWSKKRVLLYLHGGLNSEDAVAKRVVAFRDKCLANGVYPLHLMWETGALETLKSSIADLFTSADQRARGGLLDGMKNAKDLMLELSSAPIGKKMWGEMKENAWRASAHRRGIGAVELMKKHALAALAQVSEAERQQWELHVVAHSAGSILFAHAVEHLSSLGIPFKTLQFFAPAVRIDEFKDCVLKPVREQRCPRATLYLLSEQQELDDSVGPYGRSLLWLVSNALEDQRGTPLLGMKCFFKKDPGLRRAAFGDVIESSTTGTPGSESASDTHGGFDNDPYTMNSVLHRILGKKPAAPFEKRDLNYD